MKEVVIIGSGPAGAAAALELLERNCKVTLLDEQPTPGGQIYRNVTEIEPQVAQVLGKDYLAGQGLMARLVAMEGQHKGLNYCRGAVVWSIDRTREVCWRVGESSYSKVFDAVIIATGALERPMPLPGWTLPGVLTVGAAQIIMKTGGQALPNAILIGSGPLLYLVAQQMTTLGHPPKLILDTSTFADEFSAAVHLRPSRTTFAYLAKGLGLLFQLVRAGVKRVRGVRDVQIHESNAGLEVSYTVGSKRQVASCEHALLHAGVVPNTQITRALDAEHEWDETNACFNPITSEQGRLAGTEGFWIAGDGASIMGAEAAAQRGTFAALSVSEWLQSAAPSEAATKRSAEIAKYVPMRRFLNQAYAPKQWFLTPEPQTIVCRCEEVTAAQVEAAFVEGAQGPNQAKAFTRCGMGACQGRYCGLTVTNIFAKSLQVSPSAVGYYRIRTPLKPIRLGELASHESH